MWGGGKFVVQNKVLPGYYFKFLSASKDAITLSDRGKAAVGLELDWGAEEKVITVSKSQFQKDTAKYFGYDYVSDKVQPIREVFKYATHLLFYRLNGGGEKATCKWGTAKYSGVRGNALTIVVAGAVDEPGKYDVFTYLADEQGNNIRKDKQRVASVGELEDNDFIVFKKEGVTLEEDAGVSLTGGTNGVVTGASHQDMLAKLERLHYHTLGCNSTDAVTMSLYEEYQKRMSHECGKVAQLVEYGYSIADKVKTARKPDSYDIIVVENAVISEGVPEHYGIFWVLGAEAGCAVNKTVQNRIYNGEYEFFLDYTQDELALNLQNGRFMFHETINSENESECRVLDDINSFVTVTEEENSNYKKSQLIRVLYQIITDVGATFNEKWQGITPNDADGRAALKGVIVKYLYTLQGIRAIQNVDEKRVLVEQGDDKGAVFIATPIDNVVMMFQCYNEITVE